MTERLVVIGAGGFAREVLDVVEAINLDQSAFGSPRYEVVGFCADPAPDDGLMDAYEVPYLGGVAEVANLPREVGYVIGIGAPSARQRIDVELCRAGRPSPVLVHPSATLGREVRVGPGSVVCSHVSITNHIRVGRHVHVNLNSTVGHDATLGDYVTVSPLVAISGRVTVGEGATLGTGSSIIERRTVGAWSVVGAGAAVVRDVPERATVVGVPARVRQ